MLARACLSLIVSTLLLVSSARADTTIPPGSVSGVWTAAGSPYLVSGGISIPGGSTLTIEEGVEVQLSGGPSMLTVAGTLRIEGTAASPVEIHGDPAVHGGVWTGIVVAPTAEAVSITGARIGGAGRCIDSAARRSISIIDTVLHDCGSEALTIRDGNPILSGVVARDSGQAGWIIVSDGTTRLQGFRYHDNVRGLLVEYGGTGRVEVENAVAWENGYYGLRLSCTSGAPSASVSSSTIHRTRGVGIQIEGTCGNVEVVDSIVSSATSSAISRPSGSPVALSYSSLYGSRFPGIGFTEGAGMIDADPLYVAPPTNLHLQPGSPMIDAASASALALDHDGLPRPYDGDYDGTARGDVGAYEYSGPTCGDGLVEGIELCDDGDLNGEYDRCSTTCDGPASHCGDGVVDDPHETCDDGNDSDEDACLTDCTPARCGDGFVAAGIEECDDGDLSANDACLPTCVAAICGDGFEHWGVEECDDGNDRDDDACLSDCTAAVCGDGIVAIGFEECDDGNTDDDDACSSECVLHRCGDGMIRDDEECDDGNVDDGDGCSAACIVETPAAMPDAAVSDAAVPDAGVGGDAGGVLAPPPSADRASGCSAGGPSGGASWCVLVLLIVGLGRRRRNGNSCQAAQALPSGGARRR